MFISFFALSGGFLVINTTILLKFWNLYEKAFAELGNCCTTFFLLSVFARVGDAQLLTDSGTSEVVNVVVHGYHS